jgi:hypothetical protein
MRSAVRRDPIGLSIAGPVSDAGRRLDGRLGRPSGLSFARLGGLAPLAHVRTLPRGARRASANGSRPSWAGFAEEHVIRRFDVRVQRVVGAVLPRR